MILSHEHKFIFFKTNKTAGTSIEILLSRSCGDGDIITPIGQKNERIRQQLGYRSPQNYQDSNGEAIFYNHMTAKEVRKLVEKKIWRKYYKFCFERNPWDRVVSLYYFRFRDTADEGIRPSLSEFIQSGELERARDKWRSIYSIRDRVVVDRVCKYEDLVQELKWVLPNKLGIFDDVELPNCNSGFRPIGKSYQDLLTDDDKDIIARIFDREINLLNYEY